MKISKRQIEIIEGGLLGDAHAEKRGKKTRLRWRYGWLYKEYLMYLWREMEGLRAEKISEHKGKVPCHYFSTRSMLELNSFRDRFYEGRKKIIPLDIERVITPLSMAIWVMDDGHISRSNMVLNTHRYSKEDQERVLLALKRKFNIDGTLNKDRGNYRILISSKSTRDILIPTIKVNVQRCFEYKLGNNHEK